MLIPIILSGGCGSRLWPISRKQSPKQMLNLKGQKSLLQNTVLRIMALKNDCYPLTLLSPIIICNEEQRFLVNEQLHNIDINQFTLILEPEGKNTAPAIALAVAYCYRQFPKAILLILPSDHYITDEKIFLRAIELGYNYAQNNKLITFGIPPRGPDTGFGYIQYDCNEMSQEIYKIQQFIEKPDYETANKFFKSKNYFWNSGIFMFQTSTIIDEFNKFAKDIFENCSAAMRHASTDSVFIRPKSSLFSQCESIAFDYAIMEKSKDGVVIPLDCNWNDLGTWQRVWEISDKDINGNAISGDVITHDVSENYISSNGRLIAAIGVQNQIIIETADAVLVADQRYCGQVKNIVSQMEAHQRIETQSHRKVYRPWGLFEILAEGENYKTKRLLINPGAKISLQMHQHRSEHWIIVRGTATIVKGNKNFTLTKNMSIYIPEKTKHRISNLESEVLELIEVQTGAYLGEDDIVRFEDTYGRISKVEENSC